MIGVRHPYAHIVSAMAEHDLAGPVIGVAYNSGGETADGAARGGDIFVADDRSFVRVVTFRPVALAGGDATIRNPWRIALAALLDAFEGDPPLADLRLFDEVDPGELDFVRWTLDDNVRTVATSSSVGRYFDAVGALVLARPRAVYEGQLALELESVAGDVESAGYHFCVNQRVSPWVIDLRPTIRGVADDLVDGRTSARISARFHETLIAATTTAVYAAAERFGRLPVVVTGGCFQNARLTAGVRSRLTPALSVFTVGASSGRVAELI